MDSQDSKEAVQMSESSKSTNSRKRYTEVERKQLNEIAKKCKTEADMYRIVEEENLSEKFGRTKVAICKQIENKNDFFWAGRS